MATLKVIKSNVGRMPVISQAGNGLSGNYVAAAVPVIHIATVGSRKLNGK